MLWDVGDVVLIRQTPPFLGRVVRHESWTYTLRTLSGIERQMDIDEVRTVFSTENCGPLPDEAMQRWESLQEQERIAALSGPQRGPYACWSGGPQPEVAAPLPEPRERERVIQLD